MYKTPKNVNVIENDEDKYETPYSLDNINSSDNLRNQWEEKITFLETGKSIRIKLNTGAESNVMGKKGFKKLGFRKNFRKTAIEFNNLQWSRNTGFG